MLLPSSREKEGSPTARSNRPLARMRSPRLLNLAALADALARHVGAEAGSAALTPCALHDAEESHSLVASAGFRNVRARPTIKTTRLPLVAEFVPGHLVGLPMAPAIARLTARPACCPSHPAGERGR